ncbi:MAG: ABC transporter permease [Candidatus Dormibacteraeota bacterium]|nr:ABC transporter permease [Candidatus Dormibacteraeota bacterium]
MRSMVRHRDLLWLLTRKDLRLKYKGTALGFLWSLLNPLLLMLVYSFVFTIIARFPVPRYPVFLLAGILPWNTFAIATSSAATTIIGNGNLIRRVRFPREFLPLASVLSSAVNLTLSLGILLVFALYFHQPLGLPLLALPMLLVFQMIFTAGVALILAAVTVYLRDVENLVGVFLTVMFFLTPILYPLTALGGHKSAYFVRLNPMAWLITDYQAIWHENRWPDPIQTAAFGILSGVMLMGGWLLFRRLEQRFAEEV